MSCCDLPFCLDLAVADFFLQSVYQNTLFGQKLKKQNNIKHSIEIKTM